MQLVASASKASELSPSSTGAEEGLLRLRHSFPLTLRGSIVLLGSCAACFHYGFKQLDLVFFGAGLIGLILIFLCFLLTLIATALLRKKLETLPAASAVQVECDYWSETGFVLPRLWFLPLVSVDWTWLGPPSDVQLSHRGDTSRESIRPRRRGVADAITRRFDVGDVFGFCKISLLRRQASKVQFIPSMGNLQHIHILRGLSAGDEIAHPEGPPQGDRYDMRHYVPGDPIRFVLWKVFAKSRQLVIRTPEQAISRSRKTAVYMVAGKSDEASAGAARMAIEHSAFGGDWVFGADGTKHVAKTKRQALATLAASASVPYAATGKGLAHFLEHDVGQLGRAVVFLPARRGPWLDHVRQCMDTSLVKRVQFVVGIDALERISNPRLDKLYSQADPEGNSDTAAARLDDLRVLIESLGQQLLVVDRQRGQAWTAAQLAHYLQATPTKPTALRNGSD